MALSYQKSFMKSSLRSMTGFGSSLLDENKGRLSVELLSLNRRHLDLQLALPRSWASYELPIRNLLKEKLARGQLRLTLQFESREESPTKLNRQEIKRQADGWKTLAEEMEIDLSNEELFSLLSKREELFIREQELFDWEFVQKAVVRALDNLVEEREREGALLAKELLTLLSDVTKAHEKIDHLQGEFEPRLLARLQEKLEAVQAEDDERVRREVALYADRADIREELTRLKSHCEAFRTLLETEVKAALEPKGKKLEFLLQEMQREVNTIGSKVAEAVVSSLVVEMKSLLEKMREQVQNIE